MIKADQPTIFKDRIIAVVSSIDDGPMKLSGSKSPQEIHKNRQQFLEKNNIKPSQTVLVRMSYETNDFKKYGTVQKVIPENDSEIDNYQPYDALATNRKGIALFLPLADCVGAVLYDSKQEVLMVSHLGRHNVEQDGARHSVGYMAKEFQSNSKDILVWMSPAAGRENYPLYAFNHKSLHKVNKDHFLEAGILPSNIEICEVDTTKSENYHSHSEFVKGNHSDPHGRFAIVAMMPTQKTS